MAVSVTIAIRASRALRAAHIHAPVPRRYTGCNGIVTAAKKPIYVIDFNARQALLF